MIDKFFLMLFLTNKNKRFIFNKNKPNLEKLIKSINNNYNNNNYQILNKYSFLIKNI
jgi:hypothetical protein